LIARLGWRTVVFRWRPVGFQLIAGADYDLSERYYLTSELLYSDHSGLDLKEKVVMGK